MSVMYEARDVAAWRVSGIERRRDQPSRGAIAADAMMEWRRRRRAIETRHDIGITSANGQLAACARRVEVPDQCGA